MLNTIVMNGMRILINNMMRLKVMLLALFLLTAGTHAMAQTGLSDTNEEDSTLYVVDSAIVGIAGMHELTPDKIASISVVKGAGVVRQYGEKAAGGVIYIETKAFARKHYTALFSAGSPAYAKLITTYKGDDTRFAYILNDRLLTINPEGELSAIAPAELRQIRIIPAKEVKARYNLKDKVAGVIITTGALSAPGDGASAAAK